MSEPTHDQKDTGSPATAPETAAPSTSTPTEEFAGFRLQLEKGIGGDGRELNPESTQSGSGTERAPAFRPRTPRPPPLNIGGRGNSQTPPDPIKDQEEPQPSNSKTKETAPTIRRWDTYRSPFSVSDCSSNGSKPRDNAAASHQTPDPVPEAASTPDPAPAAQQSFFFIPTDDPRIAPHSTTPIPGESPTSYRIRDQITRSEHLLGRRLTAAERDGIETLQRELATPLELSATDPTTPGSPEADLPPDMSHYTPGQRIEQLEAAVGFLEGRLVALMSEMDHHRSAFLVLESRVDGAGARAGGARSGWFGGGQKQPQQQQQLWSRGRDWSVGWIVLCLISLVWIVMEGVLHSRRFSDGYGPYLNKGYNGLQSVVVFHSWPQFLWLAVAVMFLGYHSVSGVLRG
ncbi:hypothetical protein BT67DRAFT_478413 [Trichocladium antarcticum]|uniref:Uncharacterized protein n=1 Tax=Trichocladium antarcticum TaxID=1450529 RepID=A0AAN6UJD3_9PEZI|nr:hypothetical protein BT67DRAFT_478413 [Trichocladium antarcticum]